MSNKYTRSFLMWYSHQVLLEIIIIAVLCLVSVLVAKSLHECPESVDIKNPAFKRCIEDCVETYGDMRSWYESKDAYSYAGMGADTEIREGE